MLCETPALRQPATSPVLRVVDRPLVAQVTKNDAVAHAGAGQRLDVVKAQLVAMHHLVIDRGGNAARCTAWLVGFLLVA